MRVSSTLGNLSKWPSQTKYSADFLKNQDITTMIPVKIPPPHSRNYTRWNIHACILQLKYSFKKITSIVDATKWQWFYKLIHAIIQFRILLWCHGVEVRGFAWQVRSRDIALSPMCNRVSKMNEIINTKSGWKFSQHYSDVIMGAMPSQITSLTIVYLTVYAGADQRKHQSFA